jgi:hypothetical protein
METRNPLPIIKPHLVGDSLVRQDALQLIRWQLQPSEVQYCSEDQCSDGSIMLSHDFLLLCFVPSVPSN